MVASYDSGYRHGKGIQNGTWVLLPPGKSTKGYGKAHGKQSVKGQEKGRQEAQQVKPTSHGLVAFCSKFKWSG